LIARSTCPVSDGPSIFSAYPNFAASSFAWLRLIQAIPARRPEVTDGDANVRQRHVPRENNGFDTYLAGTAA
jgi:hypothetical protein